MKPWSDSRAPSPRGAEFFDTSVPFREFLVATLVTAGLMRVLSEPQRFGSRSNHAKSQLRVLYQTCTFSVSVSTKNRLRRRAGSRSRESSSRPPLVGQNPTLMSSGTSPRNPACFRRQGQGGKGLPYATNARKGRFRPKKRHSTWNPAETFQPPHGLAENRPNFSDVTGPSRHLVQSAWSRTRIETRLLARKAQRRQ
jgi:hypothetical protein